METSSSSSLKRSFDKTSPTPLPKRQRTPLGTSKIAEVAPRDQGQRKHSVSRERGRETGQPVEHDEEEDEEDDDEDEIMTETKEDKV